MKSPPSKFTLPVDAVSGIDRLERSRFTRYLLDVLVKIDAGQGAVVGLEGAWGSGKTWVLRQLAALAQEKDEATRPAFVEFNPWMVSGTNDLVVALLSQLSRQLAEQGSKAPAGGGRAMVSKAAKAIDKYASALVAVKHVSPALDMLIPGAGLVVGGIATAADSAASAARAVIPALPEQASKKSLVALRSDIEKALKTFSRKTVVIVDDLDRIAPGDVASMVQAIKAVADFPQVVYLLAYDAHTLAQALRKSLRVSDGHSYLEKIIQVSISMPELPARRFQPYAVNQIRSVLPAEDSISTHERNDLRLGLPLAAALMQTPRDVLRLCTRLSLAAEQLNGKVNLADLAVVEAVVLKVPDFLLWMKRHRLPQVTSGVEQYDTDLQQRSPFVSSLLAPRLSSTDRKAHEEQLRADLLALGSLTGDLRAVYQHAVDHLFSLSASKLLADGGFSNQLRLARFRHWYRWQCFTDHQEPWEIAQVQAMVSDASSAVPLLTSIDAIVEFSAQVCDLKDNLVEPDSTAWAEQFILWDKSDMAERIRDPYFGYGPFEALLVLLRYSDETTREAAWSALVNRASLEMSAMLLMRAVDTSGLELPTPAVLKSLNDAWFGRLKDELERLRAGTSSERHSAFTFLSWAPRLQPVDDVRSATCTALERSDWPLAQFFGDYGCGDPHKHHGGQALMWDMLPEAHVLAARVNDGEPDFKSSHGFVWQQIEEKMRESATPATQISQ
jgi:hypothetical protein